MAASADTCVSTLGGTWLVSWPVSLASHTVDYVDSHTVDHIDSFYIYCTQSIPDCFIYGRVSSLVRSIIDSCTVYSRSIDSYAVCTVGHRLLYSRSLTLVYSRFSTLSSTQSIIDSFLANSRDSELAGAAARSSSASQRWRFLLSVRTLPQAGRCACGGAAHHQRRRFLLRS